MSENSLYQHLSNHLQVVQDDIPSEFVKALQTKYSDALIAIVFYGSCLRTRSYDDAVLDFYAIVDDYRRAYAGVGPALLNKILPPNVYFEQADFGGSTYQAKYAVVSRKDLIRYTSPAAFHPYFWARFVQPVAVVYARDSQVLPWLVEIQQQAVQTFLNKTHCMLRKERQSQAIWEHSLQLTYHAELRTESKNRATTIYAENADYFNGVTAAAIADELFDPELDQSSALCTLRWRVRIALGKLLSVLRLLKAATTFVDGIDYIAWKIQRHTGESIEISQRLRKYPWLFCWPLLWRLYRRGLIR